MAADSYWLRICSIHTASAASCKTLSLNLFLLNEHINSEYFGVPPNVFWGIICSNMIQYDNSSPMSIIHLASSL